jgi:phospho-N-acetylmuramoyl-pentapeptide-transferase
LTVKTILLSSAISMIIALIGTRPAITVLRRRKLGQQVRTGDHAPAHEGKSGTPIMGGIVIIIASLIGYLLGHLFTGDPMTISGILVLFLMTGLGAVGFVDDFLKLFMRRSLGLRSGAKLLGQVIVGAIFAVLAIHFPDSYGLTPASEHLSFDADFGVSIGVVLFVAWVLLMVTATSNGVNLTDGLDGLATGASILVLAAYVLIGNWQWRNDCTTALAQNCYNVRDPLDAAVVAALAIVTRTDLLLLILCGLFVIITMSVVIQVASYKTRRKRVFKMAPLHHHFELVGWAESTIVVRFWLIAAMFVAGGLGIFYIGWFPS